MINKLFIYLMIVCLLPFLAFADVTNTPGWTLGSSGGTSYALGINFTVNLDNVYLVSVERYSGANPPIAVLFEDMVRNVNTTTLDGAEMVFDPPVLLSKDKSYQIVGGDNTQAYTRKWGGVSYPYTGTHVDIEHGCDLAFVGDDFRTYCNNPTQAYNWNSITTRIILPIVVNSSWSITTPYIIGDANIWDTGGQANVTYNSLALTVNTNINTNMSCNLDVDRNYTEMIDYNILTKAPTTETTSHSITLFENISLGEHCLYCAFINPDGIGGKSGCLNFSYEDKKNTFNVADLGGEDFSYQSTSYITGFTNDFNVSKESEFAFLTAFNVQKLSAGPTNVDVIGRFSIDGVPVLEEVVRSVSTQGSFGSAGFFPVLKNLSVGNHNITLEFKSSVNSQVGISNIDIMAINLLDNDDNESFDRGFETGNIVFDDPNYVSLFNYSYSSLLNSGAYIILSYKVHDTDNSFSSFLTDDNFVSPYTFRSVGPTVGNGMFSVYHDIEHMMHNMSLFARENSSGSVNYNFTLLRFNTRLNDSHVLSVKGGSNSSTNLSNTLNLSSGKSEVLSLNTSNGGESVFFVAHASIQSVSSNTALVVESDSGCRSVKNRTFVDNIPGVVYLYGVCDTANTTLRLSFESDGAFVLFDEGLDLFSIDNLNVGSGANPPIPNSIVSPVENASVFGMTNVDWNVFNDPNNDLSFYNVTLNNRTTKEHISVLGVVSAPSSSLLVDWSSLAFTNFSVFVIGVDDTGLSANSSVNIEVINSTYELNLTSPVDGFNTTTLTNFSFGFVTNQGGECALITNGTDVQNITALVGSNNISYGFDLVNNTWVWNVECVSDNVKFSGLDRTLYLSYVSGVVPVFGLNETSSWDLKSCPSTLAHVLLIFIAVVIALALMLIGFGVPLFGVFGSIVLFIVGLFFLPCSLMLGIVISCLGFLAILYYIGVVAWA